MANACEEQRCDAVLADMGLQYVQHRQFGLLSTGEQRRALIGRALMTSPDLLILDEPCNGLDVPSREQLLRHLNQRGAQDSPCPFIYVTHQIEEILPTVTHVALLKEGKIFQSGPKREVITDEILSSLYGLSVKVTWVQDRPWLQVLS